tara:strand:+ start:1086 stop:2525 length:1440 start_codon:yes stop_codon:yes gene_type:complete
MTITTAQENWARAERDKMLTAAAARDLIQPNIHQTGGAVVLLVGGEVVFSEAIGRADVAKLKPWNADTIAGMRSGSKNFTGMVVAKLVEEGLMSYDDTIGSYDIISNNFDHMPTDIKNPSNKSQIDTSLTVRHHLCHASAEAAVWEMQTSWAGQGSTGCPDKGSAAAWFADRMCMYTGAATNAPLDYADKSTCIALLCAEEAAINGSRTVWKAQDMLQEMFAAYGLTRTYASVRWDSRTEPSYFDTLDVVSSLSDLELNFAEGSNASLVSCNTSDPSNPYPVAADPFDYIAEYGQEPRGDLAGAGVCSTGGWNAAVGIEGWRTQGYASCYSTANDLALFASRVKKTGYYLTQQQTIDNMFDYDQAGNYWGISKLHNGYPTDGSWGYSDNVERYAPFWNGVYVPHKGWSLGHYIQRNARNAAGEDRYEVVAASGAGGGGYGSRWVSVPELDIACALVLNGYGIDLELASDVMESYVQTFY